MKNIINGALYSINFNGTEASQFKGSHPTLIVRTLKEDDIYIAIPLTSFTSERWTKCKAKGWGIRVHSTNSIARIDKFKIIDKSLISGRWKTKSKMLKITSDELKKINVKLDKYINLSSTKALKEYDYHINQYELLSEELTNLVNQQESLILDYEKNDSDIIIKIPHNNCNYLSKNDLCELIFDIYSCKNPLIYKENNYILIKFNKYN